MMDLVAALAISQFEQRPAMEAARRANADLLSKGLADVECLIVPSEPAGRRSVWHQYTIRLRPDAPVTRDELVTRLTEMGIGCGVYYPKAAYDYDCYRSHPRIHATPCPNAEAFALSVLSLPVHQHLSRADVDAVVAGVRSVLGC